MFGHIPNIFVFIYYNSLFEQDTLSLKMKERLQLHPTIYCTAALRPANMREDVTCYYYVRGLLDVESVSYVYELRKNKNPHTIS